MIVNAGYTGDVEALYPNLTRHREKYVHRADEVRSASLGACEQVVAGTMMNPLVVGRIPTGCGRVGARDTHATAQYANALEDETRSASLGAVTSWGSEWEREEWYNRTRSMYDGAGFDSYLYVDNPTFYQLFRNVNPFPATLNTEGKFTTYYKRALQSLANRGEVKRAFPAPRFTTRIDSVGSREAGGPSYQDLASGHKPESWRFGSPKLLPPLTGTAFSQMAQAARRGAYPPPHFDTNYYWLDQGGYAADQVLDEMARIIESEREPVEEPILPPVVVESETPGGQEPLVEPWRVPEPAPSVLPEREVVLPPVRVEAAVDPLEPEPLPLPVAKKGFEKYLPYAAGGLLLLKYLV
jgi:hypothetical protein